jgi:hypothetical protein
LEILDYAEDQGVGGVSVEVGGMGVLVKVEVGVKVDVGVRLGVWLGTGVEVKVGEGVIVSVTV